MATRQKEVEALTARLTKVMDEFIQNTDDADRCTFGWMSEDLPRLMAKSAMATWEAAADVQDFMKANGVEVDG